MNTFQLKAWWRYRRTAKGRHGVHSPFIYRFVEEGLGTPIPKKVRHQLRNAATSDHEYAQARTLYCSLQYLAPATLRACNTGNQKLLKAVAACADVDIVSADGSTSPDCILLGNGDPEQLEREFSDGANRLADGLLFIVTDMHTSPHNNLQWLRLQDDPRINLSIDLWHVGLLFYRADFKERQHFVLKYRA